MLLLCSRKSGHKSKGLNKNEKKEDFKKMKYTSQWALNCK
jgi:hypothetical protein